MALMDGAENVFRGTISPCSGQGQGPARVLGAFGGVSDPGALGQAESRAKGRFRAQERAPTIDNGAI